MKKILLLWVIILLCLPEIFACGCERMVTVEECNLVFTGKVISVKQKGEYEITFEIISTNYGDFKGKTVTVVTPCLNDGCCGIAFEIGQKFKVYAYYDQGRNYTDLCTPTHLVK